MTRALAALGAVLVGVAALVLVTRRRPGEPGLIAGAANAVKATAAAAIDALDDTPIGRRPTDRASRVLDALEGPLDLAYDPNPPRVMPGSRLQEIDLAALPQRRTLNVIGRDRASGAARVLDALEGPLDLAYDPNPPAPRGARLQEIDLSTLPQRRPVDGPIYPRFARPDLSTRLLDRVERALGIGYTP